MPKVKLLTSMAGIDFSHNAGDIIDCNEAEAVRFISAGIAEPVETAKVERAVRTDHPQGGQRKRIRYV
jgi:hypothetical protein